jgi:hypothetical protein
MTTAMTSARDCSPTSHAKPLAWVGVVPFCMGPPEAEAALATVPPSG